VFLEEISEEQHKRFWTLEAINIAFFPTPADSFSTGNGMLGAVFGVSVTSQRKCSWTTGVSSTVLS
jgi:hypothetical protein